MDELATAIVSEGQTLTIQVCRREGTTARATLSTEFVRVTDAAEPANARVRLLRVSLRSPGDAGRLAALGLDTTDHPAPDHWDVLVTTDAEERRIQEAGLTFAVQQRDVVATDRANRLAEGRAARRRAPRASVGLPSGRTSYRTLPEHEEELKRMAQENPGFVRLFTLPGRTWEGREILGVEIAENVAATGDGRPAYIQVGTHHAREWPAAEATTEFGLELVQGYKEGDPRLAEIVRRARTFVIPVLNADGFDATIQAEGLAPGGNYTDPNDAPGPSGSTSAGTGAYKRKNCRPADPARPVVIGECLALTFPASATKRDLGVDLNRNYGVEWGGPGTSSRVPSLVHHGPGPFSEPETDAFRRFVRDLQPTVLITNHTYTGLILRPPGTSTFGPAPDEERLRALGDAMARETNYVSQYSYQLYDTTGTTDDYIYDGLGAFSYTPEIGRSEFHPAFGTGWVPEYDGRPEQDLDGVPTGRKLGGLREAFTLAGLAAIDPSTHSVLTGTAPAGRVLRLRKDITYRTSERPNDDGVQHPVRTITEPRTSTLVVPASGTFRWHVNPSDQPRSGTGTPWRLTCEDTAGQVFATREVHVARGQSVDLGPACDAPAATEPVAGPGTPVDGTPVVGGIPAAGTPVGGTPAAGTPAGGTPAAGGPACAAPSGFRSVDARRRGSRALLRFRRTVRNPVTIDVFQAPARGRSTAPRRVAHYTDRQTSRALERPQFERTPAARRRLLRPLPHGGCPAAGGRAARDHRAPQRPLRRASRVRPAGRLPLSSVGGPARARRESRRAACYLPAPGMRALQRRPSWPGRARLRPRRSPAALSTRPAARHTAVRTASPGASARSWRVKATRSPVAREAGPTPASPAPSAVCGRWSSG
jgi:hypothetical protein